MLGCFVVCCSRCCFGVIRAGVFSCCRFCLCFVCSALFVWCCFAAVDVVVEVCSCDV